MGLLNIIRNKFPIHIPVIVELPEEELLWGHVKASSLSISAIEPPNISRNICEITLPDINELKCLDIPELTVFDADILLPLFDIVDLFNPLAKPSIDGTIFIKKEREHKERGQIKTRTTIEIFNSETRLNPKNKKPKGLDIFEMLLPILMPPAATEFGKDLLFPQELYPFQTVGVKWLFENDSALLADDMGLGKTVQSITASRALIRRSLILQTLVICPKSVLLNWMHELNRWAPELVAIRIHGEQLIRKIAWQSYIGKCHVLVTTYDTVRQDRELVKGRIFDLIIADEIQRIKNPNAYTSRVVRNIPCRKRWGLTGTPLENKLEDLVSIFGFIKPDLFKTSEMDFIAPRIVRERIKPYLLRRRKEEALPELPDKIIDTKLLELTESQRKTYDREESEGKVRLHKDSSITIQHVLALITKLKQICNFDPITNESIKIEFLKEYLEDACSDDQKALIISQFVNTLSYIEHHVKEYDPLIYTGELSLNQRSKIVDSFNNNNNNKVLLLSLKAGGLGLNLTRANYVLHFDRWWNPAVERQVEDRTHRIGQTRRVFATRLICHDTIEEKIEQLLEQKKILFNQVVDELSDVDLKRVLSEEELFGLFGLQPPRRVQRDKQEAEQIVAKSEQVESTKGFVVKPEEPFSNIIKLRQILRGSEEYIWWADLHFTARGLEELIISIDPALIEEVRILSGTANVNQRAKQDFQRFREELLAKGISAEWRILNNFSHDRFIISKNLCYNVPPINSLLRGQYSEILQTTNVPPFTKWWQTASPIEELRI